MKKNIFMALMLMALCVSGAFAGSKSRQQWNYDLPKDGIMTNMMYTFLDIAAASNTAFKNTTISTTTLVAAATTFTLANADYTDIIVPRNVVILSSCNAGGTYSGAATITGTDARGNAQTETIYVSTYVSAGMGTGSIAWSTIESIRLTTISTTADAINVQVGSGVKIGLPNKLVAASRITKVIEAGSLSTTYTADTTYDTITFAAAPDGSKDYTVRIAVGEK